MANNLRVFNTNSEYQSADLVHPAVSYVIETDKVIYEPTTPPVFQGKWKATYSDSHVESAECDSSSEIVENEINLDNLVSVEIGDYCVTEIGAGAFRNCRSLTSIVIPNSVINIGNSAFNGSSLTSCTIGNGVTDIGKEAFSSCSGLTSVTIPDSVTIVNWSAFRNCTSLANVTIGNSVTTIWEYVFKNCTSLASINIPDSVTTLGSWIFDGCTSLASATIGSGVTSIGEYTFYNCSSLTSINIPSGVTSIGRMAFKGCTSLSSVTVNAVTPPTLEMGAFGWSGEYPIYVPDVDAYKSASGWGMYASRIFPIP